jgi:hypothetical protein
MTRASRSLVHVLAAFVVAMATMAFECGPPGRDVPCTDQIVEGDVLHVEIIDRYAQDGGVWAGGDFNGFGSAPSCIGIDVLAIGATFDAKIEGSHESMLCTQLGFVPLSGVPHWIDAPLPESLISWAGAGSSEVALTTGAVVASGGCLGRYGVSLITTTGDVFAEPSLDRPYGTFLKRYFGTTQPDACGPDFAGTLDVRGATYCGDMFLVRVTR